MAELKQYIQTSSLGGTGAWGKSENFNYDIERAAASLVTSYPKPKELRQKEIKIGDNNVPVRCKYSYDADWDCHILARVTYLGSEVLNEDRTGNVFGHFYYGDGELNVEFGKGVRYETPVNCFLTPDFLKYSLNSREKIFARSREPLAVVTALPFKKNYVVDDATGFINDADRRKLLAAFTMYVIKTLQFRADGKKFGIKFCNCGTDNQLIRWINAICLLFPRADALRITFDTMHDTHNGKPNEAFPMNDVITGFVYNGKEQSKIYNAEGYTYQEFDMSNLNLVISNFNSKYSEEYKWLLDLVENIYADDSKKQDRLNYYLGFLETSVLTETEAAMKEAADCLASLLSIGDNALIDFLGWTHVNYRRGSIGENVAVQRFAAKLSEVMNSGDLSVVLKRSELFGKISDYTSNVVGGNGVIDGYGTVNAELIAENIWNNDTDFAEVYRVMRERNCEKASALVFDRIKKILGDEKNRSDVIKYCSGISVSSGFSDRIENLKSVFGSENIEELLKGFINDGDAIGGILDGLCCEYVKDRKTAKSRIAQLEKSDGKIHTKFVDRFVCFIVSDPEGKKYADRLFAEYMDACGVPTDGSEYGELETELGSENINSAMTPCAVSYCETHGETLISGVINGDEKSTERFAVLYSGKYGEGVKRALNGAFKKVCESCADVTVKCFMSGKFDSAKLVTDRISKQDIKELKECFETAFVQKLGAASAEQCNGWVEKFFLGDAASVNEFLKNAEAYISDYRKDIFGKYVDAYISCHPETVDAIARKKLDNGEWESEYNGLLEVGANKTELDRMLEKGINSRVRDNKADICRLIFDDHGRFVEIYRSLASNGDAVKSIRNGVAEQVKKHGEELCELMLDSPEEFAKKRELLKIYTDGLDDLLVDGVKNTVSKRLDSVCKLLIDDPKEFSRIYSVVTKYGKHAVHEELCKGIVCAVTECRTEKCKLLIESPEAFKLIYGYVKTYGGKEAENVLREGVRNELDGRRDELGKLVIDDTVKFARIYADVKEYGGESAVCVLNECISDELIGRRDLLCDNVIDNTAEFAKVYDSLKGYGDTVTDIFAEGVKNKVIGSCDELCDRLFDAPDEFARIYSTVSKYGKSAATDVLISGIGACISRRRDELYKLVEKDVAAFTEKHTVVKKYSSEAADKLSEILTECLCANSEDLSKQAFGGGQFKELVENVRKCGGKIPDGIMTELLKEFEKRLPPAIRDVVTDGDCTAYDELMAVVENYLGERRAEWEEIRNSKVKDYLAEGISVIVGHMISGSELGKKGFEFFCYFVPRGKMDRMLTDEIDRYVKENAHSIVEGIWDNAKQKDAEYTNINDRMSGEARNTLFEAAKSFIKEKGSEIVDYYLDGSGNERVSRMQTRFGEHAVNAVREVLKERSDEVALKLCTLYVGDFKGVSDRLEELKLHCDDIEVRFNKALQKFVSETEEGRAYVYGLYSYRLENNWAVPAEYSDLSDRFDSVSDLYKFMEAFAYAYAENNCSSIAKGVLDGDETLTKRFNSICREEKNNGIPEMLRKALLDEYQNRVGGIAEAFVGNDRSGYDNSVKYFSEVDVEGCKDIFTDGLKTYLDESCNGIIADYFGNDGAVLVLPMEDIREFYPNFPERFIETVKVYLGENPGFIDSIVDGMIAKEDWAKKKSKITAIGILSEDADRLIEEGFSRKVAECREEIIEKAFGCDPWFNDCYGAAFANAKIAAEEIKRTVLDEFTGRLNGEIARANAGETVDVSELFKVFAGCSSAEEEMAKIKKASFESGINDGISQIRGLLLDGADAGSRIAFFEGCGYKDALDRALTKSMVEYATENGKSMIDGVGNAVPDAQRRLESVLRYGGEEAQAVICDAAAAVFGSEASTVIDHLTDRCESGNKLEALKTFIGDGAVEQILRTIVGDGDSVNAVVFELCRRYVSDRISVERCLKKLEGYYRNIKSQFADSLYGFLKGEGSGYVYGIFCEIVKAPDDENEAYKELRSIINDPVRFVEVMDVNGALAYAKTNGRDISEGVIVGDVECTAIYRELRSNWARREIADEMLRVLDSEIKNAFAEKLAEYVDSFTKGDAGVVGKALGYIKAMDEALHRACLEAFSVGLETQLNAVREQLTCDYIEDGGERFAMSLNDIETYCGGFYTRLRNEVVVSLRQNTKNIDSLVGAIISDGEWRAERDRLAAFVGETAITNLIAEAFERRISETLSDLIADAFDGGEIFAKTFSLVGEYAPATTDTLKKALFDEFTVRTADAIRQVIGGDGEKLYALYSAVKPYFDGDRLKEVLLSGFENGIDENVFFIINDIIDDGGKTDVLYGALRTYAPELTDAVAKRVEIALVEEGGIVTVGDILEGLFGDDRSKFEHMRDFVVKCDSDDLQNMFFGVLVGLIEESDDYKKVIEDELYAFFDGSTDTAETAQYLRANVYGVSELLTTVAKSYCTGLGTIEAGLVNGDADATEKYRRVAVYGGQRACEHLVSGAKAIISKLDFSVEAAELMSGDESAINKRFDAVFGDEQCPEKLRLQECVRECFEKYLVTFTSQNEGQIRMNALADAYIEGTAGGMLGVIERYYGNIEYDVRELVIEKLHGEKDACLAIIAGEVSTDGEDYVTAYRRMTEMSEYIGAQDWVERTRRFDAVRPVETALQNYFTTAEFALVFNGLADPAFEKALASVKAKLEFFYGEPEFTELIRTQLTESLFVGDYAFNGGDIFRAVNVRAYGHYGEMLPLAACFKAILSRYGVSSDSVKADINEYVKRSLANGEPEQAAVTERIKNMIAGSAEMRATVREMVLAELSAAEEYTPELLSGYCGTVSREELEKLIWKLDDEGKRRRFLDAFHDGASVDRIEKLLSELSVGVSGNYSAFANGITDIARFKLATHGLNKSDTVVREIGGNLFDRLCMGGLVAPEKAFGWMKTMLDCLGAVGGVSKEAACRKLLKQYVDNYGLVKLAELSVSVDGFGYAYLDDMLKLLGKLGGKENIAEICKDIFTARCDESDKDLLRTLKTTVIYMIFSGKVNACHYSLLAGYLKETDKSSVTDDGVKFRSVKANADIFFFPKLSGEDAFKELVGSTGTCGDVLDELVNSRVTSGAVSPAVLLISSVANRRKYGEWLTTNKKDSSVDSFTEWCRTSAVSGDFGRFTVLEYAVNAICACSMTANLEDTAILKALSYGFGEVKKGNGTVRVNRGNAAAKAIVDGYASIWSACEKGVEPVISEPAVDYSSLSEDELVQVLRLKEYLARRAAFKCLVPVTVRTEEVVKRGLFRKTVETVTVSVPIPVGVDKLCSAFSKLFDGECGGAKELFAGALAELTVAAEPTDEMAVGECINFLACAFGGVYFNRLKKSSSHVINGNTVAETKIAETNWI